MIKYLTYLILLSSILFSSVSKQIIKNGNRSFIIELNIDALTESDLFPTSLLVGLPTEKLPNIKIDYNNESPIPFNSMQHAEKGFKWINQQKLKNLETATLMISPISSSNNYYKNINIQFDFDNPETNYRKPNKSEIESLKNRVLNWEIAKDWIINDKRINSRISTLPSGRWLKFNLAEDGMNSIPFSSISSLINDITEVDPRSFSIFMTNELGRSRTQAFDQPMAENLIEVSILVIGQEDGTFDSNDKIIFYGRGPSGFDITNDDIYWHQNLYFNSNVCWLLIPDDSQRIGKRIQPSQQPDSGTLIDYGIASSHIELDLINLRASGTEWVSSPIVSGASQTVLLEMPNPKVGSDVSFKARFRGHSITETSSSYHELSLLYGSTNGNQIGPTISWTGSAARTLTSTTVDLTLNNGPNLFFIKNSSSDANSSPYLDYLEVHYGRELFFEGEYEFVSPISGQNVKFSINGIKSENTNLWNITNPDDIHALEIDDSGFCNFSAPDDHLSRFVIFNLSEINTITNLELIQDQKFDLLRQIGIQSDYVIIGPEKFRDESMDLIELRNPAVYASLEDIYIEFSGGNPDPMGIRSFIQWTQESWQYPQPNCALILGDAGYDYRNITGQSSIIVPTIQVQSSRTYATDDLLSAVYGNIPEIATGRYPARNEEEVSNFIEKVISIETEPEFGPWRQKVTLVADDAARPEPNHGSISTGKSHTLNSEQLALLIPNSLYTNKIYMMEYPEVSDASAYGVIKPDATEALMNTLNSGTAIISYIGHGSPYQLAQERLLDMNRGDINQINTGNKFPLWIVGTCSFGHFDDPISESFAEELIREPMNAASMIISTTRPITVTGNERYTQDLFEAIFIDNNVSESKVGILLQSIKDGTSEAQYFHLFGDPAMQLPIPKDTLISVTILPDTLRTLETGTYSGIQNITDDIGSGYVGLIDADEDITREYEILSETYSLSYTLPGATLFRGQFSFSGSSISGQIRIPEDISYSNKPANLLLYINDDQNEARAVISTIQLAGGEATGDNFGPQIIFETASGTRLEANDHLIENESLIVRLSDPLGINLTNETGHEITITNLNSSNSVTVTDDFYYDQNSITTGKINFPIDDNVIHLKVKAWDNANNPSEKEIKLFRAEQNKLKIYNAFNFPNPFINKTQFSFEVTQDFDLKFDVYSLGGRRIKSFEKFNLPAGFNILDWDGRDAFGNEIANGVYIYRLKVINGNSVVSYIGRCAKYQ